MSSQRSLLKIQLHRTVPSGTTVRTNVSNYRVTGRFGHALVLLMTAWKLHGSTVPSLVTGCGMQIETDLERCFLDSYRTASPGVCGVPLLGSCRHRTARQPVSDGVVATGCSEASFQHTEQPASQLRRSCQPQWKLPATSASELRRVQQRDAQDLGEGGGRQTGCRGQAEH